MTDDQFTARRPNSARDGFQPHQAIARRSGFSAVDALFAGLALISALPVLLVRYPESADYLNHLARLYVLTAPTDDPVHAVYRVHWHLIPNLGLELIAMPLAWLFSLEAVMKTIWTLCVLGLAAATWFLHRSLHERTQPTLLLAALTLLNLPLALGLLNFALGLLPALVALGLWFRMGDRLTLRSALMLNLFTGVTLIMHVAAAAALALTVATLHVFRRPFEVLPITRRSAEIATGFILPLILLIAIGQSRSSTADPTQMLPFSYLVRSKIELVIAPVFTGSQVANAIGAVALWGMLYTLIRRRDALCHPRFIVPLLIWLAMLFALPHEIGSAAVIDLRLAVFPTVLLIAATSFNPAGPRLSKAVIGVASACVLARVAILVPEWYRHDASVQSFRAIDTAIARGAKVLVAFASENADGACHEPRHFREFDAHIPALLVIDRAAFVSTVFAMRDLQPIEARAAVRDISTPDAGIISWAMLAYGETQAGQRDIAAAAAGSQWRIYPHHWRVNYDYLALRRINCPVEIPPQPDLVPVAESATYRLYRIVRTAP